MKKIFILFLIVLSAIINNAQTCQWARNSTYEDNFNFPRSVKSDIYGNVIITGIFRSDSIKFGNTPTLLNNGLYDIFIAKYNSQGNILWSKSAGGSSNDFVYGVATDSYGNIYITGGSSSLSLHFGNLPAISYPGFFIAKYDTSGNALWVRNVSNATGQEITIDLNNNIYVTGFIDSTVHFGNTPPIINNGNINFFIAKYDSSGNALWARSAGGSGDDQGYNVSTDKNGNVYAGGLFTSQNIQFNGTPALINNGISSIFIAKYDSSGNALWARSAGGNNFQDCALAVDAKGNVYLHGKFNSQSIQFGNTSPLFLTNTNIIPYNVFIAKYDSSGNALWAKKILDIGIDLDNINADSLGNFYIEGRYDTIFTQFGNTPPLPNNGYGGCYFAKFDSNGSPVWAKGIDQSMNSGLQYTRTALDKQYNFYLFGGFMASIQFGNSANTKVYVDSNAYEDLFIAKFSTNDSLTSTSTIICSGSSTILSVLISLPGVEETWHWYSSSCGGTQIGTGTNISVSPSITTTYYLRAEGANFSSSCVSIQVIVGNTSSIPYFASATPNTICSGGSSTLGIIGGTLSEGASWNWYSGSCGGIHEGYGDSLIVMPTLTTTYFVRAEGVCNSTGCVATTVAISGNPSIIPTSAISSPSIICSPGDSCILSLVGGNLGSAATWNWYSGSCGGQFIGTGTSEIINPVNSATYFIRAEGICNTTACITTHIILNVSVIPLTATSSHSVICSGDSSVLGFNGGSLALGATWDWYLGSCGGTFKGIGSTITVFPSATTTYFIRGVGLCNTTNCVSITIIVNNYPGIPASISGNSNPVSGNTETYSTINDTGITYSWTAPSGWISISNSNSITFIIGATSGVVSVIPNNSCGAGIGRSIIVGNDGHRIEGYFIYANASNTPLDSIFVFLFLNGSKVDSIQADDNGYYEFNNIPNGAYNIIATTHKPWSGANSTDAVKVKRHFAGSELLTSSIRLHSGDVNKSLGINTSDAVKITRRFVGSDTSFTRGNWVFEKPTGGDTINVSTYMNDTVIVNGSNVIQNFSGLCVGDVNGSDYPSTGAKSLSVAKVKLMQTDIKKINSNELIDIPIITTTDLNVGAISLIIKFPKEFLEIKNIQLSGIKDAINLVYNIQGDELKIAWFANDSGITIKKNNPLIYIKAKITNNFGKGNEIKLIAENNKLCEIADKNGNTIENVNLITYSYEHIMNSAIDEKKKDEIKIYPNPANSILYIENANNSEIGIYNMNGELFIKEKSHSKKIVINISGLPENIYTVTVLKDTHVFSTKIEVIKTYLNHIIR